MTSPVILFGQAASSINMKACFKKWENGPFDEWALKLTCLFNAPAFFSWDPKDLFHWLLQHDQGGLFVGLEHTWPDQEAIAWDPEHSQDSTLSQGMKKVSLWHPPDLFGFLQKSLSENN